jgi:hypothetical protein
MSAPRRYVAIPEILNQQLSTHLNYCLEASGLVVASVLAAEAS